MSVHHPLRNALFTFAALSAGLTALMIWKLSLAWPLAWLAACNLVALGIWGFDKWRSKGERSRVPELALHAMAVLGATPASILGMLLLRHKSRQRRFVLGHSLLFLAQIALFAYVFREAWQHWLNN